MKIAACTKDSDASQALRTRNVTAVRLHANLLGMQACMCALGFTAPNTTGMCPEAQMWNAANAGKLS